MNKQEVINYLNNRGVYADVSIEEMAEVLAVNPKPKGEWVCICKSTFPQYQPDEYKCSVCGHIENRRTNFCSNCGAKMTNGNKT